MAKVRVYELAKELGVESKTLLSHLKEQGEFVRSASSTIEPPVVRKVRESFTAAVVAPGDTSTATKDGPVKPAAKKSAGRPGVPGSRPLPVLLPRLPRGPRAPVASPAAAAPLLRPRLLRPLRSVPAAPASVPSPGARPQGACPQGSRRQGSGHQGSRSQGAWSQSAYPRGSGGTCGWR